MVLGLLPASMRRRKDGLARAPGMVLGAGGAARAIVAALGHAGVTDIRLVNRTRAKAEALSGLAENMQIEDWHACPDMADGCGLMVNTTSLGMVGKPPLVLPGAVFGASPEAGLRYCLCAA